MLAALPSYRVRSEAGYGFGLDCLDPAGVLVKCAYFPLSDDPHDDAREAADEEGRLFVRGYIADKLLDPFESSHVIETLGDGTVCATPYPLPLAA